MSDDGVGDVVGEADGDAEWPPPYTTDTSRPAT
jgi:hypothetical protein